MCVVHFCISSDSKEILLVIKVPDTVVIISKGLPGKKKLVLTGGTSFQSKQWKKNFANDIKKYAGMTC
jgi:hypothetical protein